MPGLAVPATVIRRGRIQSSLITRKELGLALVAKNSIRISCVTHEKYFTLKNPNAVVGTFRRKLQGVLSGHIFLSKVALLVAIVHGPL